MTDPLTIAYARRARLLSDVERAQRLMQMGRVNRLLAELRALNLALMAMEVG